MKYHFIALCIGLFAAGAVQAQEKAQTLRPEVGKPIQAAVELLKSRRGREALAKAREAQAVTGKSAHESMVVDQVLGQAAAAAGAAAAAARAFEAAAGSSAAPDPQRRHFLAARPAQYSAPKAYATPAHLARRLPRGRR